MSFINFILKEKDQQINMRLIALSVQKLHNEGFVNVIEQSSQGKIRIEVNNKSDADKVQQWLDAEGLVY